MVATASDDAPAGDDVFSMLNDENRERSALSTSSSDDMLVVILLTS
jgi:hypothetical protein